MWGLYLISLFTHIANLIYLPILLVYNKTKFLQSKIVKIFIIAAGITLPLGNIIIIKLADHLAKFLPDRYALVLLQKSSVYYNYSGNENDWTNIILEHLIVFTIIIFVLKNKKIEKPKEKLMLFLYPVLLFLMLVGRDIHMFSNRFAFILFPFGGLFYYFLIEYKWKIFKKELLSLILILKISYFGYYLYNVELGNSPFNYLDNKVFSSSIFDYIEIVYDGFNSDIKIKQLPRDRVFN